MSSPDEFQNPFNQVVDVVKSAIRAIEENSNATEKLASKISEAEADREKTNQILRDHGPMFDQIIEEVSRRSPRRGRNAVRYLERRAREFVAQTARELKWTIALATICLILGDLFTGMGTKFLEALKLIH